jgi:hypothetical protein
MKSILNLFIIFISTFLNCNAQSLQWVSSWGGNGDDYNNQLEYYNNELYTGGNFTGTVTINGTSTISSTGGDDIFFSKYNQNGQLSWIKTIGSTSNELVDLKLDNQGNIILLGSFSGVMDFDPSSTVFNLTSVSNCCPDLFFAKYANNGDLLWAKNLGGFNQFFGNSLAIDNAGNIYFAGILNGEIDFDPGPNIYNLGTNFNGFFTKYSPQGELIWAHKLEGAQNCNSEIYSISIDNNNQMYIAGNFMNSVDFDPSTNQNIVSSSSVNDYDAFFASYTENGDLLWVKKFGNPGMEYAFQIKSDNNGSLYLSGTAPSNNIDFDPSNNVESLSNGGFFLAKYTTSGDFNWVTNASGVKFDLSPEGILTGCEIVISHLGVAYGSSNFSRIASGGNLIWEKSAAYNTRDLKDLGSKIFLTGSINGSHDVDTGEGIQMISTNGQQDVCLTHYLDCNTQALVSQTINPNSCSPYISPNNQTYLQSGTYSEIIQNMFGCDSVHLTINLTLIDVQHTTISATICSGSSYLWNNQSISSAGNYIQTFQTSNGCDSIVTLNLSVSQLPELEICVVGVDSLTNNNRIVWEEPLTTAIDSFYIYKESNVTNVYTQVGSRPYDSLSVWIDPVSNPAMQSYRYKISAIDTCGEETPLSSFHKTTHLTISQGIGGAWNLIWSHYEGINFGSYNIYRGTSTSNMTLLTTIQNNLNSFTDLTPPPGVVYYQIEIINPNTCNPAKSMNYSSSKSNRATNDVNDINEISNEIITIYPNPFINDIIIEVSNGIVGEDYIITDFSGRILTSGIFNTSKQKVDISNFANGVYILQLTDKNIQKRIIKQ